MKKVFTFTQETYFMLMDAIGEQSVMDTGHWAVTIMEKDGFELQVRKEPLRKEECVYLDICVGLTNARAIKEASVLCLEAMRVGEEENSFVDVSCANNCIRIACAWFWDGSAVEDAVAYELFNIIEVDTYPESYEAYLAWCADWDELHGFTTPVKQKRHRHRKIKISDDAWEPSHGWDENELMSFHNLYRGLFG